jgi:hypothetical protein
VAPLGLTLSDHDPDHVSSAQPGVRQMYPSARVHTGQQRGVHPIGVVAILLVRIVAEADQTEWHWSHQLEIG